MLGLFSGKSDHPLVDPRAARELFERLGQSDPFDAVDEIAHWLESTSADAQIKPRRQVELIIQLDDTGLIAARKLAREFLMPTGHAAIRNNKLWQVAHQYWRQLADSYRVLFERLASDKKFQDELRGVLPVLQLRLLHAFRGGLKWDQFRYGPIDPDMWLQAGKLFLAAEKGRWHEKKMQLGAGISTSIAEEYLRLLLFHAASMDSLQPAEIELAEHLLNHFLPAFNLVAQPRPGNAYWVDVAKPLPPTRLAKLPEISPTLRFFATASALSAIKALSDEVSARQSVPISLGLGQMFPPQTLIGVLQHLAEFCAPQPPLRSHARLPVTSRMRAAEGFQAAVAAMHGNAPGGQSWEIEDVSRGGFRAQIALTGQESLSVGTLLALCPDGGSNWLLGIVRRISRRSLSSLGVGIETIGRLPDAVGLDNGGLGGEGLLLDVPIDVGNTTLMAVSPGIWEDFRPLSIACRGAQYRLRPLEAEQRGADYVIGRYWVDAQVS